MHAIYSTPPVLYIAMWRARYITYSYVVMYNVSQEMAYMYVLCLIKKIAYNVYVFSIFAQVPVRPIVAPEHERPTLSFA